MKIVVVIFDGFTDVDAFLPFDFFHRVKVPYGANYNGPWEVLLVSDRRRVISYSGVLVEVHGDLSEVDDAQAVFIVSGDGSRAKIADPSFMAGLKVDPSRQVIGAIDSGALILAALGHLKGLSATTYPIIMDELTALGVRAEKLPLVPHGNVATAGGCLAALDLCAWMVAKLLSVDAAAKVRSSFEPIGGFEALATDIYAEDIGQETGFRGTRGISRLKASQ